jgi:hypothetical protein
MKKFLIILLLFLLAHCYAINIVVQSKKDVVKNTKNADFSAIVIQGASFKNNYGFYKDDIINGKIISYSEAKRAKRSAYFIVSVDSVYRNNQKLKYDYSEIEAKVIKFSEKDMKKLGVKAGVTAGLHAAGHYIPGVSPIYYFTKGFVKPEKEETRFASGVKSVYKNSPLSYVEKGDELTIKNDDFLTMKLYNKNVPKWQYFKRTK